MYLIDPIPITANNGVLTSSNVGYPDIGVNPNNQDDPMDWPRWVRGREYVYDSVNPFYVVQYGALYELKVTVPASPANASGLQLPPGHAENEWPGGAWLRVYPPSNWSSAVDYTEGALVAFPNPTYPLLSTTDPLLSAQARFDLASAPNFGAYADYPSGIWRRNAVQDDGESILPKTPTMASQYWDCMEPPVFEPLPEVPMGELTTFGGRVWRKRVAVMAKYEAPPSAPNDWALVKTSNRFAMFDSSVQSQTRQTRGSHSSPVATEENEVITVVLQVPTSRVLDAVALLNLAATSVRVQVSTAGDSPAEVYDKTVSMVTTAMIISNWYDWFFAPRHLQHSALFDDIPATTGATVTITITNTGGQAACGACIIGKRVDLGMTLYGVSIGIKDYSVKTEDDFGNIKVTQRAYSGRCSLPVIVPNDLLEPLKQTMINFRARPALWVGAAHLPGTIIYGYYKAFSVTVPYPTESTYNLELEELT